MTSKPSDDLSKDSCPIATNTFNRFYYAAEIGAFLRQSAAEILEELCLKSQFFPSGTQRNAWHEEINTLKTSLNKIDGYLILEYSIPRMGKRVDAVVLLNRCVVVLEFKVGERHYAARAIDQVLDYALDLKNFHYQSHDKTIAPIIVATEAGGRENQFKSDLDGIYHPILANKDNLGNVLLQLSVRDVGRVIDKPTWMRSGYRATPTIIEAAQALYRGHNVGEISRSDAGAYNLTRTAAQIARIIAWSKNSSEKSICFVTGVPGAGKTLAGLNIANCWHDPESSEHAVFLSGNGPLVEVLREALARDDVERGIETGRTRTKTASASKIRSFVQHIYHFRDEALVGHEAPMERVVIFDEAQRAWNAKQTAQYMKSRKGVRSFDKSEPEFLISIMDRHPEWATIICLIGEGQEIHTGEAGIEEWFAALSRSFRHWNVFMSDQMRHESREPRSVEGLEQTVSTNKLADLHLSVSVRSFRSEQVAALVEAILDCRIENASAILHDVTRTYPIAVTRDISYARAWLRERARGTERYGMVASSEGLRLKPVGINVKAQIEPKNWFLNGKCDVRSCYSLEDVATEFQIQGLELDWTCVAWDADFRHEGSQWGYYSFRGTRWQVVRDQERRRYLMNAYRVLLTRARQGMVILVPHGDPADHTRPCEFYDQTYQYLKMIGMPEISQVGTRAMVASAYAGPVRRSVQPCQ